MDRLGEYSATLSFFSGAIVLVEKMGSGIRESAEDQPFTPIIEALRWTAQWRAGHPAT